MTNSPPDGATLFGGLPGAPPEGDPSWSPAGAKPAPTEAPYQPVMVDHSKLSPIAKHEFRQAVSAGTREAYEAWAAKHAPDGQQLAEAADAAPAVDRAEVDLELRMAAIGLDGRAADAFDHPIRTFTERLSAMPPEAQAAEIEKGEQAILEREYRGSEHAMAEGLKSIEAACKKASIDIDAVNQSGILADPAIHRLALSMARTVNGRRS